ncbi:MAG: low molecular weight phosphotyrosine protein phosphatase [Bdellovibrionales bacterium]|nr:low molecular weight phosphotyrosine protein phosphatase [Bdellovibrionales bacterium]
MRVLFVCLGNICRSPTAEGIFRKKIEDTGLSHLVTCDSAGTSAYHSGQPADGRMTAHAKDRGYMLTSRARQLIEEDLENFDIILTMDNSNYENARALDSRHQYNDKIKKMVSYCKIHSVDEVPDPYYGGDDGFQFVIDILEDACDELILEIKEILK